MSGFTCALTVVGLCRHEHGIAVQYADLACVPAHAVLYLTPLLLVSQQWCLLLLLVDGSVHSKCILCATA